jgi:hypothetical protein
MDMPTFRTLARSYCVCPDGTFTKDNGDIVDDDHYEMLYGLARTMVTPILPIWKSLAQQSVHNWPSPDSQHALAGNTRMYADEFLDGRHDKYFVRITNGTCWESVEDDLGDDYEGADFGCIMDPRFQGMLLGICSLMPSGSVPYSWDSPDVSMANARKLLQNHPIENLMDDGELSVVFSGVENMTWMSLRSIGVKWTRVWYSARAIQRAYRERLRRKRFRMIQLVLVPIIVRNK